MVMRNAVSQRNRQVQDPAEALLASLRAYVPDWMSRAACGLADPAAFWPDEYNTDPDKLRPGAGWADSAQQVCATCPVIADCREFADDKGVSDGAVWHGTVRRGRGSTSKAAYPEFGYARTPDAGGPEPPSRLSIEELLAQRDRILGA